MIWQFFILFFALDFRGSSLVALDSGSMLFADYMVLLVMVEYWHWTSL